MDDAYFDFSDGTGGSIYTTDVVWFDEYDLAGEQKHELVGERDRSPADQPWQNGVYRRRFQNGMVLVNPRGNGDHTVTMEQGTSGSRASRTLCITTVRWPRPSYFGTATGSAGEELRARETLA